MSLRYDIELVCFSLTWHRVPKIGFRDGKSNCQYCPFMDFPSIFLSLHFATTQSTPWGVVGERRGQCMQIYAWCEGERREIAVCACLLYDIEVFAVCSFQCRCVHQLVAATTSLT